jgi:uncharacterized protein (DUF488 family)
MLHQLYTWGYTGTRPADLVAYVAHLDAVVLDVRWAAWSRHEQWRPPALRDLLGAARYRPMKALGNENYQGGPVKLHDPEAALAPVEALLHTQPGILLCACADPHQCHRSVAAQWLAERLGLAIIHLPGSFACFNNPPPQQLALFD